MARTSSIYSLLGLRILEKRIVRRVLFVFIMFIYFSLLGASPKFEFPPIDIIIGEYFIYYNTPFLFVRSVIFGTAGAILGILIPYVIKTSGVFTIFRDFFDVKEPDEASERFNESTLPEILGRLDDLETQTKAGIAKSDYATLTEDVTKRVSASVDRSLLQTIEDKYGSRIAEEQHLKAVDDGLSRLIEGLARERSIVSTRSAINLSIGMVIAGFGVWILYQMLTSITYTSSDWQVPVLQFVSRLSVVIVIEIFAYFFLNLYRGGLQEIKYFRNEMTNVMSRQIALRAAMPNLEPETIARIVLNLAETERNFVLKKGESTVGLEQNRLEREQDTELARTIMGAVKDGVKEGIKQGKRKPPKPKTT